jgi:hypothetical protein
MLPPKPQGVPASTPTYLIDAKASVSLTSKGYGITADGKGSYTLSWRSDSILHSFSGDIYCPPTCTLSATFVSIVPGTSISFSGNYVQFSADTTAPGSNGLIITPTCQPLSLNLLIDSQPALSPFSLFQSNGRLSATSVMPFSLVDSSAGL